MTASYHVRPMRVGDAEDVARLAAELGYEVSAGETCDRFAKISADAEHAVFVAEGPEGHIAGWIHVHTSSLLITPLCAEIGGLVVGPAARRQGAGRALMQEAEGWASQRGVTRIRLRSNAVRDDAHHFYEALGYANTKTSLVFEKAL